MNPRKRTMTGAVLVAALQALLLAATLAIGTASTALAQVFPFRPIRILVGFAPGPS